MVKKESGFNFWGILDFIAGLSGKVNDIIVSTEEKIIQKVYSTVLLISGLIFLSLSFVFLMSEYSILSQGWSFLMMGIILVMVSLIIKNRALNRIAKRRGK
jgi:VIT1/CCC1 family predicted Fe2+/Mn2+ transporter